MKKIMILLLFLLIPFVYADMYNIRTVNKCVGEIEVFDRSVNVTDYFISGCITDETKDKWICSCGNPSTITLKYNEAVNSTFDFIIEYYLDEDKNNNSKRTYSYEGLYFEAEPIIIDYSLPSFFKSGGVGAIFVIVLIGGALAFLLFIAIKKLFKDDEEEDEDIDEEDVDEFFRNNI